MTTEHPRRCPHTAGCVLLDEHEPSACDTDAANLSRPAARRALGAAFGLVSDPTACRLCQAPLDADGVCTDPMCPLHEAGEDQRR